MVYSACLLKEGLFFKDLSLPQSEFLGVTASFISARINKVQTLPGTELEPGELPSYKWRFNELIKMAL